MKIKRLLSVFLLCVCLSVLLAIPAQAADAPDIRAKAALLVDVNTDAVAYAQNIHEQNYPASLTKVMTALLILEKASGNDALLTQEVTAPESAFASPYYAADGSTAGIKAGEVLTVKQLLQCMLIVSANEACNILAEWHSGSISAFVDAMNAKAEALGCEVNPFRQSPAASMTRTTTPPRGTCISSPRQLWNTRSSWRFATVPAPPFPPPI